MEFWSAPSFLFYCPLFYNIHAYAQTVTMQQQRLVEQITATRVFVDEPSTLCFGTAEEGITSDLQTLLDERNVRIVPCACFYVPKGGNTKPTEFTTVGTPVLLAADEFLTQTDITDSSHFAINSTTGVIEYTGANTVIVELSGRMTMTTDTELLYLDFAFMKMSGGTPEPIDVYKILIGPYPDVIFPQTTFASRARLSTNDTLEIQVLNSGNLTPFTLQSLTINMVVTETVEV